MSNTIAQLKEFFQSGGKTLTNGELREFWSSLTDDEKDYYKMVDLETGRVE